MQHYQEENDWAADFFKSSLIFGSDKAASGSELYDAYTQYCQYSGITALSSNIVLPRIALEPGVKKSRIRKGQCYFGVGVDKYEPPVLARKRKQTFIDKQSDELWNSLFD